MDNTLNRIMVSSEQNELNTSGNSDEGCGFSHENAPKIMVDVLEDGNRLVTYEVNVNDYDSKKDIREYGTPVSKGKQLASNNNNSAELSIIESKIRAMEEELQIGKEIEIKNEDPPLDMGSINVNELNLEHLEIGQQVEITNEDVPDKNKTANCEMTELMGVETQAEPPTEVTATSSTTLDPKAEPFVPKAEVPFCNRLMQVLNKKAVSTKKPEMPNGYQPIPVHIAPQVSEDGCIYYNMDPQFSNSGGGGGNNQQAAEYDPNWHGFPQRYPGRFGGRQLATSSQMQDTGLANITMPTERPRNVESAPQLSVASSFTAKEVPVKIRSHPQIITVTCNNYMKMVNKEVCRHLGEVCDHYENREEVLWQERDCLIREVAIKRDQCARFHVRITALERERKELMDNLTYYESMQPVTKVGPPMNEPVYKRRLSAENGMIAPQATVNKVEKILPQKWTNSARFHRPTNLPPRMTTATSEKKSATPKRRECAA